MKKIIYIDLDDTIFKYKEKLIAMKKAFPKQPYPQSSVHFFYNLEPFEDAIDVINWLFSKEEFDVWFLTAPSKENTLCYTEKRLSLDKHFGSDIGYRMIISPNKGLNKGHYLIDDITEGKGQEEFEGKILQFGTEDFPDWQSIKKYFETLISYKA